MPANWVKKVSMGLAVVVIFIVGWVALFSANKGNGSDTNPKPFSNLTTVTTTTK